ncbi:hypothetical protein L9F63_004115, partial [Diploptera punctata]
KYLIIAFLCLFLFKFGRTDDPTVKFTGDLLKVLYSNSDKEANTVFSPESLYTVIALLQQGGEGDTLQELTDVLNADAATTRRSYSDLAPKLKSAHNGTTLEIANKIYLETEFSIEPNFRNIAVDDFAADIDNIEFRNAPSAADTINKWVSDNTHGRITELVSADSISPDTEAMLLNAVYFNGEWLHRFNSDETVDSPFTTLSGSQSTAPMMHLKDKLEAGELTDVGAKYVRLPFKDQDFSMIVVVPNAVDGLGAVIDKLQEDHLDSILHGMERTVDLTMPKFKFSTTSQLVPTLQKMGLNALFTDGANLSGIARSPPLKVSDVLQKAEIEVDEKGATASAVT